ncbi:D-lyxose ketol-isomerase [subsurface metagenome]
MLKKKEIIKLKVEEIIRKAGIKIIPKEAEEIEVADFGLNNLNKEGTQILTFFNTKRVSAKVIAMFPYQTMPEHWHPSVKDDPGKEETIRVIDGTLYMYIPGEDNMQYGFIPEGKDDCYTVRHELVMKSGDQITLEPRTKHWFQAGEEIAVFYSMSTCARDLLDGFTDPDVVRKTDIV